VFKSAKKTVSVFTALLMLLAALPLAAIIANAAGDDITASFTDPKFLAAVREKIKKPEGPIFASDVKLVRELIVARCEIADLSGIEYFSALKTLICPANNLTEIDITKNTALRSLYCSNNRLTELNVSNNASLEALAFGGNPIAKIDLTKNMALIDLNCYNSILTELDVSKNTALKYLDCPANRLTELDVSNNTALQGLWCGGNRLNELDVSKNTELWMLNCEDNLLTELDVSGNTELMSLICGGNRLTELDVSKNIKIEALKCSYNYMISDIAIKGLEVLTKLKTFEFFPQLAFYDEAEIAGAGMAGIKSYDKDGREHEEGDLVGTGSYIFLEPTDEFPFGEKLYIAVVMGDVDGDGEVTAADARKALRASSRLEKLDREFYAAAAVLDGKSLTAADARKILSVSSRLDVF